MFIRSIISLFFFAVVGLCLSPIADAQASCATVRCAGGGCIDTPQGPMCGQRTTCASTLCAVGNQCVETGSGAQCVPNAPSTVSPWPSYTHAPSYRHDYSYSYGAPHIRPRRYQGYRHTYRPWSRYYYRPHSHDHLRYTPPRHSYYPTYPNNSARPYYPSPYYPNSAPSFPVNPQPNPLPNSGEYPQPNPVPSPSPSPETEFCTAQYDPVCAQKQVQCVQAPCPPLKRTFGNACEASREDYTVISSGTCQ